VVVDEVGYISLEPEGTNLFLSSSPAATRRQPHHDQQRLVGHASTFGDDVFVARDMTLCLVVVTTPDREHGRHRKLASGLSNGGRRRVLSDARELASGQQLDANVYLVGPDGGVSIARELSGNGASICLSRVCTGFRYSGWLFESTQLDPCAHALAVGGLGPCDPRRWPDPAIENRHLLRRARPHGCSNPSLPAVALAPLLADDLKKQLADRSVRI
jgi:hypothetical protein